MDIVCKKNILGILKKNENLISYQDFLKVGLHSKFSSEELLLFFLKRIEQMDIENSLEKNISKMIYLIYAIMYYDFKANKSYSLEIYQEIWKFYQKTLPLSLEEESKKYFYWILKLIPKKYLERLDEVAKETDRVETVPESKETPENEKIEELKRMNKNLRKEKHALEMAKKELLDKNRLLKEEKKIIEEKYHENNFEIFQMSQELAEMKRIIELKKLKENDTVFSLLYEALRKTPLNYEQIKILLATSSIQLTDEELKSFFEEFKKTYSCEPSLISIPLKYRISTPHLPSQKRVQMPIPDSKPCRLLFTSDFHIWDSNENLLRQMDKLYNYAYQNAIDYIVNLGDFAGYCSSKHHVHTLEELNGILEKIDKAFSLDSKIPILALGGNHDENFAENGVDLLKYLQSNHENFCSLGYKNAFLEFNKDNKLALYHPNRRFNLPDSNELDQNAIHKYINGKCLKDKVVFSFLGHIHLSSLNFIYQYATVPSYLKDRQKNGALQVEIPIDREGNISKLIFNPLILEERLTKTTEVVWSRKK